MERLGRLCCGACGMDWHWPSSEHGSAFNPYGIHSDQLADLCRRLVLDELLRSVWLDLVSIAIAFEFRQPMAIFAG